MLQNTFWRHIILSLFIVIFIFAAFLIISVSLISRTLPDLNNLKNYTPYLPLRIYSAEGALMAEYGEERRILISIQEAPKQLKNAILAAEDERFYQHTGVDMLGIARAAIANVMAGGAKEGASTITMQVARNLFLDKSKTVKRKISEVLLSHQIEQTLSKDRILELYINKIYLGERAYGFATAAQAYFGRPLDQLSNAELAMLAGLPKAPSQNNPRVNFKRAKARQEYVLHRMHQLHYLTTQEYENALQQPIRLSKSRTFNAFQADFVAEMVRQTMYTKYGDNAYISGYSVYTTIHKNNQDAANAAVLAGTLEYNNRRTLADPEAYIPPDPDTHGFPADYLKEKLSSFKVTANLHPACILEVRPDYILAYVKTYGILKITENLAMVQAILNNRKAPPNFLPRGAVIRVIPRNDSWAFANTSGVESALVSLDPDSGAIIALVGGVDFLHNNFNHAIQAWRQPGSSFKPFIYSAALEKGYTPSTIMEDAPFMLSAEETGSGTNWSPRNYDDKYDGAISLRTALARSKNSVAIKLLRNIGVKYTQNYITRFGFSPKMHPAYLSMALGAGQVSPIQMAGAYAVFANGGYRVTPYLIDKVLDAKGNVIEQTAPVKAREGATRVISAENAETMYSMMQSVIQEGTGMAARKLERTDLAGKTGTTNNNVDAWFAGFNPKLVTITWIGYDVPKSLGKNETGGHAALPIWIHYSARVMKNMPNAPYPAPNDTSPVAEPPPPDEEVPDQDLQNNDAAPGSGASDSLPNAHEITLQPLSF